MSDGSELPVIRTALEVAFADGDTAAVARLSKRADAIAHAAKLALGRTAEARPYVIEALRGRWMYAQLAGPNPGGPPGGDRRSSNAELLDPDGLTKMQRERWRRLYPLEPEDFDQLADGEDWPGFADALLLAAAKNPPEPAKTPPMPEGRYRCIVIDPPWPMVKIERRLHPNQGRALAYPVMSVDEIAALDVGSMAADGCHLYLWVTHRFLPVGLELLAGWGAVYECVLTWRKNVGFTPFSWMYDTEHVLFARVGSLPLTQLGLRLSIDAPAVGHSVKPDAFYDRVRTASPEPRLEMFARQSHDGFRPWGAEVTA
jgi:N6-adenosine-specific RNA methylase IME4